MSVVAAAPISSLESFLPHRGAGDRRFRGQVPEHPRKRSELHKACAEPRLANHLI